MSQRPRNQKRAERAQQALIHSAYWDHGESYALADFISDAMHLCDREGWDFDEVLESARNTHHCEVEPDDIELNSEATA